MAKQIDNHPNIAIGSLAADIQRELFGRRNRVVHAGFMKLGDDDARIAYEVADMGIALLKRMDLARRR